MHAAAWVGEHCTHVRVSTRHTDVGIAQSSLDMQPFQASIPDRGGASLARGLQPVFAMSTAIKIALLELALLIWLTSIGSKQ